MRSLRAFLIRLGGCVRRAHREQELNSEIESHLQLHIDDNVRAGMNPDQARRQAVLKLGGLETVKEEMRDRQGLPWVEHLAHDIRFAARSLRKSPGFTAVAVFSLALGIGANTAIFSLVNEVLLKSLQVKSPEELVLLSWRAVPIPMSVQVENRNFTNGLWGGWTDPVTNLGASYAFSMLAFDRFRDHSETLADVFGFFGDSEFNVIVDGEPEISRSGQYVTGNYFAALGVDAMLGRALNPEDDRDGAPPAAVISHGFWQRRLGGAVSAVGKIITVNKTPVTIVGVTPPGFRGTLEVGDAPDLSLPLSHFPDRKQLDRAMNHWWLRIMGRLKPGVSREQVHAELAELFRISVHEGIERMRGWRKELDPRYLPRLHVEAGEQGLNRERPYYTRSLATLMALVGLVLLLACANVANLLLARGAARRKELAVRLALGAGRGRLVRQLFAESILLALLGGAGGVLLAWWSKDALLAMHPLGRGGIGPAGLELNLDLRVLGFGCIVAAATCVLAGLLPALRATRLDLTKEFQSGTRSTTSRGTLRLRRGLMIVQVALSVVLLIAAGLFGRTLRELQQVDLGFNRDRLVLFRIDATPAGYQPEQFATLYRRLTENMAALPAVRSVGVSAFELFGGTNRRPFWLPGRDLPKSEDWHNVNAVGSGFFETLGMPVILGRTFGPQDNERASKVAVINQSLARKYFGAENPVGRRFGADTGRDTPQFEVIGVVRDAKLINIRTADPPTMYLPFTNDHLQSLAAKWAQMNFSVRVAGEPTAMLASLRRVVREIDATLPITDLRTLDDQVERLFTQERLFARLSSLFGSLALTLACVGLYGLMSYTVLRRTGEIGIRMALGALPRRILTMVLRESIALVICGAIVGLMAAWAGAGLVAGMLYGLSPTDPLIYGAVVLLLVGIALFASWSPARRAAKIDPMVALRAE